MDVTLKQEWWLTTRGGRTRNNLYAMNGDLYVDMWDGRDQKYKAVRLPDDDKINLGLKPLNNSEDNGSLKMYITNIKIKKKK